MSFRTRTKSRDLKKGIDSEEARRKREDMTVNLRRKNREEQMQKRRQPRAVASCDVDTTALTPAQAEQQTRDIPSLVNGVNSNNVEEQLRCTTAFRKLLSIEENPPIQRVIDTGVVPRLVTFLTNIQNPKLQFEAAWTLTNIASGTSEHTQCVVRANAIPIFVQLLRSPNPDVAEQAIWALGNIAGDSYKARDLVIQAGGCNSLLCMITDKAKVTMIRNVTWCISNLCRGKPRPDFNYVGPALPALQYLLTYKDEEVVTDAAWALSYVSDDDDENNRKIKAVVSQPQIPGRLVELLRTGSPKIQTPALRTVGNIVTGDDEQTQIMINAGALQVVLGLLRHKKKTIRKEAAWTISNITAGTKIQIQQVIQAGGLGPLIERLHTDEFEVQKEAAWSLSNACSGGAPEHIAAMVQQGILPALTSLLSSHESKIILVALDGIDAILKTGMALTDDDNVYADLFEEANGVDMLDALQRHQNEEVYNKAVEMITTYFADESDDEESAPTVNGNMFAFGTGATQQQPMFGNPSAIPVGGFNF